MERRTKVKNKNKKKKTQKGPQKDERRDRGPTVNKNRWGCEEINGEFR